MRVLIWFLLATASAYHLGEDEPICWTGPSDNWEHCHSNDINIFWESDLPDPMFAEKFYTTDFMLTVNTSKYSFCTGDSAPENKFHANVHSCPTVDGFCTPFVTQSPTLAALAPAIESASFPAPDADGLSRLPLSVRFGVLEGTFSVLIHVRFSTCVGDVETVHNIAAAALRRDIKPEERQLKVKNGLVYMMTFLVGCVELFLVVMLALCIRHRHNPIMMRSQVNFLCAIIVSGMIAVSGVFLLGEVDEFKCRARSWIIMIPLTFMISLLYGRVWRVHVIASAAARLRKRKVSAWWVFGIGVGLTCPPAFVLVILNIKEPLSITKSYVQNSSDFEYVCTTNHYGLYASAGGLYVAILALCGFWVARVSSRLVAKLNEGKWIGFAIQHSVILALVVTPPAFTIKHEPDGQFFLQSMGCMLVVILLVGALVLPKLQMIRKNLAVASALSDDGVVPTISSPGPGRPNGNAKHDVIGGSLSENLERAVLKHFEAISAVQSRVAAGLVVSKHHFETLRDQTIILNEVLDHTDYVDGPAPLPVSLIGIPTPRAMFKQHSSRSRASSMKRNTSSKLKDVESSPVQPNGTLGLPRESSNTNSTSSCDNTRKTTELQPMSPIPSMVGVADDKESSVEGVSEADEDNMLLQGKMKSGASGDDAV